MASNKHVFLSYCRDNKTEVARLREDLIKAGETVWWDQDIQPGQDWKFEVREAMKDACAVLLCLSRESQAREASGIYTEALDAITIYRDCAPGSIFLIPVRLSECKIPAIEIDGTRTLDRLQHQDLFPASEYDTALKKLIRAIRATPCHPASRPEAAKSAPGRPWPHGGEKPNTSLPAAQVQQQRRSWMLVAAIGLLVATTFVGRYLFVKPNIVPKPEPKVVLSEPTPAPSKAPSQALPFYRVQIMMYSSATPPQLRIGKKAVKLDGYDGRIATVQLHPGFYQIEANYDDGRMCIASVSIPHDVSIGATCDSR